MPENEKKMATLQNVQNIVKKKERSADDYVDMLVSYFNSTTNDSFLKMNRGDISKDEFLMEVKRHLDNIAASKNPEFKEDVIEKFKSYLWGFSILEELINDESISDIKIVRHDNIRIKRKGVRMDSGVRFASEKEFKRFVASIATRNAINLSTLNADQTFTDNDSHPDWTLRFTIATEFISSTGQPYMHIRKLPKMHHSLSYFEKRGLLVTEEQINYFKKRIESSSGFLIVGKTGAGKTILYNGLLDYVSHQKAIMIIQENEEINNMRDEEDFVPHPEMIFLHTVYASGEGKVEYDLQELARIGLLFDIDIFAIGEVKGAEAKYLLNCIKTGCVGMCTAHGSSVEDGMDKVADYVTYNTAYTKAEALAELRRLETVVFVDDFEVKDVAEVVGYDREKGKLKYNHISFS